MNQPGTRSALISILVAATLALGPLSGSHGSEDTSANRVESERAIIAALDDSSLDNDSVVDLWIAAEVETPLTLNLRTESISARETLEAATRAHGVELLIDDAPPFGPRARAILESDEVDAALALHPEIIGIGVNVASETVIVDVHDESASGSLERVLESRELK